MNKMIKRILCLPQTKTGLLFHFLQQKKKIFFLKNLDGSYEHEIKFCQKTFSRLFDYNCSAQHCKCGAKRLQYIHEICSKDRLPRSEISSHIHARLAEFA